MVDVARARQQFTDLAGQLEALRQTLFAETIRLHPGASLQAAIDTADTKIIELEDGIYTGPITCTRPVIIRAARPLPDARMTMALAPPVMITSAAPATVSVTGPDVVLSGVEVLNSNPLYELVDITGVRTTLDRLLLLGGDKGQHRGVACNGVGTRLWRCHVDECWLPGRDAQALCGWKGTKDLLVTDCFLAGGAETVMFGGADNASVNEVPQGIQIFDSTLTKRPEWLAKGAQIKNAFELKSATDVLVHNCDLEYAGTAEGQKGYIVQLTPRNQSGGNPWSTVQNVLIEQCRLRYGGGAVNFLGSDDKYPSDVLKTVTLKNLVVTDLNPLDPTLFPVYKGDGRIFQFNRAPQQVTIENVSVTGTNLKSGVYLIGAPPKQLVLRHVHFPTCPYPLKIDGGGTGIAALQAYAPDTVLDDVTWT